MAEPDNSSAATPAAGGNPDFSTTNWSAVVEAGGNHPQAAAALERLCQRYWYPIYAFLRRRGASPHDAEDLTQGFFAYLLKSETLKKASRERGRFRSFLLAAISNYATNEWNKEQTAKRGGQHQIVSLDEAAAESFYQHEPADNLTPEKLFERRWAFVLVELVLKRLKEEYTLNGKAELVNALGNALTGEVAEGRYAVSARALNMNENGVKVALHRMRRRFGQLLRSEVAHTVATPQEVDEEIRHLFTAISLER